MATKKDWKISAAIMLVAAMSLGGCMGDTTKWSGSEPEKRNKVEMVRLTHDVDFSQNASALSPAAQTDLDNFLAEVKFGYGDQLVVDGGNNAAHGNAVAQYLKSQGHSVMPSVVPLGLDSNSNATRIAVERYVVTLPACPDWRQKSWPNYDNAPSSNFGCATASALGMMVANPRDLIEGQDFSGPDATQSSNAVIRYQDGKVKWPAKDSSLTGQSSGGNSDSSKN